MFTIKKIERFSAVFDAICALGASPATAPSDRPDPGIGGYFTILGKKKKIGFSFYEFGFFAYFSPSAAAANGAIESFKFTSQEAPHAEGDRDEPIRTISVNQRHVLDLDGDGDADEKVKDHFLVIGIDATGDLQPDYWPELKNNTRIWAMPN
ncbi:MAG: hypothetical protein AAGC77_11225 [Pseudomonadota bacterium]